MELVHKLTSRKAMTVWTLLLLILIVGMAFFVDWGMVISMLKDANRFLLVLATFLLFLGYMTYGARWNFLINRQIHFLPVFQVAAAGTMVNALLPGRPGDPVRIILLRSKSGVPVPATTSSIVVERWLEQIMRLAALGGAIVYGAGAQASLLTIFGSVAYLFFSFLLMIFLVRNREWVIQHAPPYLARIPKVEQTQAHHGLIELINGLSGISSPKRLLGALLWSIITWGLFWGFHFLSLQALHPHLSMSQLLAISFASLALVPPSATTLPGVYQLSMVVPLVVVGYSRNLLTSYSMVMNILEMAVVVGLGLWGTLSTGLTLNQLLNKTHGVIEDSPEASAHSTN